MAKKKVEEPVYPESPLKISRERFCELLSEQIEKGKKLLTIEVPKKAQPDPYYGYGAFCGVRRASDRVEYDDTAKADFVAKYSQWNDRNKSIYRTSFEVAESIYLHDYETHIWRIWGFDAIKEYKDEIQRLISHMQGDIERADLMQCSVAEQTSMTSSSGSQELSGDIFIVHGHNEEMKQTVARTVSQLGLNPIILHEQPNGGKTIIEKFERNADRINFAIILLSADDLAASVRDLKGVKDEDLRQHLEMRARQNVVFEMGYFTGKLGRSNVFLLLQEGVAKPGDLDGIVYTAYDSAGAWRFGLVKELKAAGYMVSADAIL